VFILEGALLGLVGAGVGSLLALVLMVPYATIGLDLSALYGDVDIGYPVKDRIYGALSAGALGAVWLLWPLLRAVAILAIDAVIFVLLGTGAYLYLRRWRRRREHAAEEEAPPVEEEVPLPAAEADESPPSEEEPVPPPVPARDRAAEVEARLQAIKRRLGKEG